MCPVYLPSLQIHEPCHRPRPDEYEHRPVLKQTGVTVDCVMEADAADWLQKWSRKEVRPEEWG